MFNRPAQITAPLSDDKIGELDRQLSTIFSKSIQAKFGTYTGDGRSSHIIDMGVSPLMVYIQKQGDLGRNTFPLAGNSVFALAGNPGVAYIPGTGYVKDAVLSYQNTGITIGSNSNVNAINVVYCYFILA
jgi:hypothetical protein